jgi:transposase
LENYGHAVKLTVAQFVKPYVKTTKNDMADAEAICEAVGRPNIRFVADKTVEQQAILAAHRARQGFVKAEQERHRAIKFVGYFLNLDLFYPEAFKLSQSVCRKW